MPVSSPVEADADADGVVVVVAVFVWRSSRWLRWRVVGLLGGWSGSSSTGSVESEVEVERRWYGVEG